MRNYKIHTGVQKFEQFQLECGKALQNIEIAYETYGELNSTGSNAILVCHALTGNSSSREWWKTIIGEGRAIDPTKYFIITPNCIGSCYGSTEPESLDSASGKKYHSDFPERTLRDLAKSTSTLLPAHHFQRLSLTTVRPSGPMSI